MTHHAGILHTVPALAGTFQSALESADPGIELVHVADPWLLRTAIETGVTADVTARLASHVRWLVDGGAEAVLVTCSSVGEAVEAAARHEDVPVLRVDAPMAADAVRIAADIGATESRPTRIAVLATLAATMGPTGRLIARTVQAASADVVVDAQVVDGAAAARQRGDNAEHDRLISAAVAAAAEASDVIVLAQASMAPAASEVAGLDAAQLSISVLTSPEGGMRALLQALRGQP